MLSTTRNNKHQNLMEIIVACFVDQSIPIQFADLVERILFLITTIQQVGFLFKPCVNSSISYTNNFNYSILFYLGRFDAGISHFLDSVHFYTIPLSFFIIFEIVPLALSFVNAKLRQIQLGEIEVFTKLVRFYQQLFIHYFYIPFLVLLVEQINQEFRSSQSNLVQIIFLLLFVFLLTATSYVKLAFYTEQINFFFNIYYMISLSILDVLKLVILQLHIVIYAFVSGWETATLFHSIMCLLVSFINLAQIFTFTTSTTKQGFKIFVNCFVVVISALYLVMSFIVTFESTHMLILLVLPIFYHALNGSFENFENSLFQQILKSNNISHIKYYFAKYFVNQELVHSPQFLIMYAQSIKTISSDSASMQVDIEFPSCQLQQILTQKMLDQFHRKLLKIYRRKLKASSKQSQTSNIIHYLYILNRIGFQTVAYQQATNLINQEDLSRTHSNMFDQSRSQIKAFKSKQKATIEQFDKSHSKTSKNSKSQEVNDLQLQQRKTMNKMLILNKCNLSKVQKYKLSLVNLMIRQKMKKQFEIRNDSIVKARLRENVEAFLDGEGQNQEIKSQVIYLLNKKLQFYLQIQNSKGIKPRQLFRFALLYCNKLIKIENQLIRMLESYPSVRVQSIACLLQSEINNNMIEAVRFQNNLSLTEDKLQLLRTTFEEFNLQRKNTVYLTFQLDDATQQLMIQKASSNACDHFYKESEFFKNPIPLEDLLPEFIKKEHQILVQRFLMTGQSKYFLNPTETFFQLTNFVMQQTKFFFDVSFGANNQVLFNGFFQEFLTNLAFLAIDLNGALSGVTIGVFLILGYEQDIIDQIYEYDFTTLPVTEVFPEITSIAQGKSLTFQTTMRFPSKTSFTPCINLPHGPTLRIRTFRPQQTVDESMNTFSVTIRAIKNEVFGEHYMLIEILEALQIQKSRVNLDTKNTIKTADDEIDLYFRPSELSEQEALAESFKILRPKQWNQPFSELNLGSPSNQQELPEFEQKQDLFSPNQSNIKLAVNDNSSMPLKEQQSYFHAKEQRVSISNIQEIGEDQSASFQADKNILKQIVNQIAHVDEKSKTGNLTSKSSSTGIKKSQFYKKFEIVQLLLQENFPNSLKLFLAFMLLQFLICWIYCIVVLIEINKDLDQFVEEIDMIQLRALIMVPHDISFILRITIITYQQYIPAKVLTQAEYVAVTDPLYNNQHVGYNELQQSFLIYYENRYLQKFFNDRYFDVYYMGHNGSVTYPIRMNIREGLYQMYSYYYAFYRYFERRLPPAGTPFQVFQNANFYKLHYWLEELTVDVWHYSKQRSESVQTKWLVFWIVFVVLSMGTAIFAIYYLNAYLQKYDKYLNLFTFCTVENLQRDIDRYKLMLKILTNSQDTLFTYDFELGLKEQYLNFEKQLYSSDHKLNKLYRNKEFISERVSRLTRCILVLLLWTVFLVFSTVASQQNTNYFQKYAETTNLYKLIQDLSYSAGQVYLYRNIRLFWTNYTYYDEFDYEQSYKLIYQAIENIEAFQSLYTFFEPHRYHVSEDFLDYFTSLSKNPICSHLSDEELDFLKNYCEKSFEGTLLKGLVPTLGYIKNNIIAQMAINNFTSRRTFLLYESEGGVIVTRGFQKMTKKLKQGILDVTDASRKITNDLAIVYMIYASLFSIGFATIFKKYLLDELKVVKRFINLVPSPVLFFDDQFERQTRILIAFSDQ